jgi:hypothetical protein
MVDCERWTVTHSSDDAAALLELGLAVGLAPMEATSEGEAAGEDEPGGESDAVVAWLGELLGLAADTEVAGAAVGEEEVGAGVGEGDGEGVGEVDGDDVGDGVGEAEGEGVLEDGSTWQLVLLFAEVPALDAAVPGRSACACAVPGRLASTPKVRQPPVSRLSAATRPCAKRIRIALSTLLVRVTLCSF